MTAETSNLPPPDILPPDSPPCEFSGVTLKVVQNCNMGCSYCYEYTGENESKRKEAAEMSLEVTQRSAEQLRDYAVEHQLDTVFVRLHGGEPLALGEKGLRDRVEIVARTMHPIKVNWGIQTNGLLLGDKVLQVLTDNNFRVGLSSDGGRTANDRFRVDQSGRSTYDRVSHAIKLLKETSLDWYLQAVVDLRNDPLADVYLPLQEHDPGRGMDFLLPLANHMRPPPNYGNSPTSYADWLIKIFDPWIHSETYVPEVEKFHEYIRAILGKVPRNETIGNQPPDQIFIRHDGSYEDVDTLLSVGATMPSLGMNVYEHPLDEVAAHPWMRFRNLGSAALSPECQTCDLVEICGGGYLPHRYKRVREPAGHFENFMNPSVYCDDLKEFIGHIIGTLMGYAQAPPADKPENGPPI